MKLTEWIIWITGGAVFTVLLLASVGFFSGNQRAIDADCRSIGYERGFSVAGKDYCERTIVSPRTRDDAR
jgi:hypothetical protein